MDAKQHWEKIYQSKEFRDVSWYQSEPLVSLEFIQQLNIPLSAAIIDVGGGDSFLVDYLLKKGYTNVTILDISATAIQKAKKRLGKDANKVKWVVCDISEFQSSEKYDFWHDRAAFHFLTEEGQIQHYLFAANAHISSNGKMVIGTFSDNGPEKCSGLPIKQYKESSLTSILSRWFQKIKCITTDHITPFQTAQNFLFCSFQKINS